MASVSNAFDALQSGASVASSAKKKKKNKKKSNAAAVETPTDENAPRLLPTPEELEMAAVAAERRRTLWEGWTTELQEEERLRRGLYVDENGKPAFLRSVLMASRALEAVVESCVEVVFAEDQGEALYGLLSAVFSSVEREALRQMVFAIAKISKLSRGKGVEVVLASKRALRDVMLAVKKVEMRGTETPRSQMKKKNVSKLEWVGGGKKPLRHDRRVELHEALEGVKMQQSVVDEMDDDTIDAVGGACLSRSVSDLQAAMSLASRPMEEISTSKRGKRNKNKGSNPSSPMMESLRQEEAAYAAEEARLNEEISNLEMKLKGLRSQLASLHVTRQHIHQRKDAILNSVTSGQTRMNGTALIPPEEQTEAIECLEMIVAQLQAATGQSDEQKKESAVSYVESLEKFFGLCLTRQEDLMKSVKFLKDSIQRRMEQEEKMKEIASAALTKDILKSQQHSKHELEQQLKDAMFDSGDLLNKVTRVETDLKQRADFVRKYVSSSSVDALENVALEIKQTHADIKQIAEEKREIVVTLPEIIKEPDSATKKRIDTKEIIKEEEMKAREEIAARLQQKHRKTPTSSQSDFRSPPTTPSPKVLEVPRPVARQPPPTAPAQQPYTRVVYMTPTGEPLDPRFIQPPPMGPPMYGPAPFGHHPAMPPHAMLHGDPEGYHPMMQAPYHPPINPAGPVARPPHNQFDPPPMSPHLVEVSHPMSSGSKPRMAWKKIGEQQAAVESDQPDLPTPGEARQQGKL